ncbi:hypothetical protein SB766_20955 [Pseudomonas sp. SIMBA_077]
MLSISRHDSSCLVSNVTDARFASYGGIGAIFPANAGSGMRYAEKSMK